MATFRELLVAGGRAYVDVGDVAAVVVRGSDFRAHANPDTPIRLLLSGCGDTLDVFGTSVESLFTDDESKGWLPAKKFTRLECKGGHAFIHARHVVGLRAPGDSDLATSTAKSPLTVLLRGVKDALFVWGMSPRDFLYWMLEAGRQVRVQYLDMARA